MAELPNIDTSGIDSLKKLKDERDVIQTRLDKMKGMKDSVSDAVYAKVHGEYIHKLNDISAQSTPLKVSVRKQYAVLKGVMNGLTQELESLRLEREELEFRHTLGEFDGDFFEDAKKDWEMKNTSKQAELDEIDNMKALFREAFDSEEDLEAELNETEPEPSVQEPAPPAVAAATTDITLDEVEDAEDIEADEEDEEEFNQPDDLQTRPVSLHMPPPLPLTERESTLAESSPEDDEDIDDDDAWDMPEEEPPPALTADEDEEVDEDDIEDLTGDLDQDLTDELGAEDLADPLDGDAADDLTLTEALDDDLDEPLDDFDTGEFPAQVDMMETKPGSNLPITETATTAQSTLMMDVSEMQAATSGGGNDPDGTMIISNPKIISMNNSSEGQVYVLGMATTSIGRSPDNDIHLTEDRISRKHSQISFGPGGYALYDLNSENGTYVNGNRIREHFLADGDIITVGTYKYLYRDR